MNWFKQFKNGDFDISDKERSERPAAGRKRITERIVKNNGKYFD